MIYRYKEPSMKPKIGLAKEELYEVGVRNSTTRKEYEKFQTKSKMINERREERLKAEKDYYKKKSVGFESMRKGAEPSLVGGSLYSKFRKRGAL